VTFAPAYSLRCPVQLMLIALLVSCAGGCGHSSAPVAPAPSPQSSRVHISSTENAIVIDSPSAEFTISPAGYVAAKLVSQNQKSSLDDPGSDSGMQIIAAGKQLPGLEFDVAHPQITDAHGRLGSKGKRIEVAGKDSSGGLQESLIVEVYDDFPSAALVSAAVRNSSESELKLDSIDLNRHRLNASLADSKAAPNDLWSFHGASIRWGKDAVGRSSRSPARTKSPRSCAFRFSNSTPLTILPPPTRAKSNRKHFYMRRSQPAQMRAGDFLVGDRVMHRRSRRNKRQAAAPELARIAHDDCGFCIFHHHSIRPCL
jgi:hypothetical protein